MEVTGGLGEGDLVGIRGRCQGNNLKKYELRSVSLFARSPAGLAMIQMLAGEWLRAEWGRRWWTGSYKRAVEGQRWFGKVVWRRETVQGGETGHAWPEGVEADGGGRERGIAEIPAEQWGCCDGTSGPS